MMSDLILRKYLIPARVLGLVLFLTACSDAAKEAPEAVPQAESIPNEPLTDAELMGISRNQIVVWLPWSDVPLSHDPDPIAPRATVRSLEITGGEGFDRAVFEFRTDAPYPGYRIAWNDSATAACGDEGAAKPTGTLLIRITPATAKEDTGQPTVTPSSRRAGLPAVATAGLVCDAKDTLVWGLGAADSTRFRVLELRDPPRLLVDVRHKDAEPAQPASTPAPAGG